MPKAIFTLTPEEVDKILTDYIVDKYNLTAVQSTSYQKRQNYEISLQWEESRFLTVTALPVVINPALTPNWEIAPAIDD